MTDDRIQVPDPALVRRAGKRMIPALIAILILAAPITIWGVALLSAGELPGLPLAVGGLVLAVAAVMLTMSGLRVRQTLQQNTVSRESLRKARNVARGVRFASLGTLFGLVTYGLVRGLSGEWWSLLTALLVGIALYVLGNGASNAAKQQERSLVSPEVNT
ncbi:hypothetical protein [Paractinoplanes toevensis]|uniref:Uncharacterized protein n=1 Tax=Paractinoplanes toevensis TaxID=571911 RepID=A0A919WC60_9ACTN|nr:hypothetical protein [Actinoplanes toevensis]GIM97539.1 hypothetical protein Ato02nite_093320 [Actinoplanes toevensis]